MSERKTTRKKRTNVALFVDWLVVLEPVSRSQVEATVCTGEPILVEIIHSMYGIWCNSLELGKKGEDLSARKVVVN